MLRVMSFNANGIRSAARKGFFAWMRAISPDVVCIQETKAQFDQLRDDPVFFPEGYDCHYFDAEKKGYSGTALYLRHLPRAVHRGLGWAVADTEGRFLMAEYAGVSIASLYMPSGSASEAAQAKKDAFLQEFVPVLQGFRRKKREFILCGDWNIAHREIDLKNWKSNQKNSGFLPHERAWMDALLDDLGFVDAFRVVNTKPDQYTWWSNRGQARANNVGWRIDYHIVTPGLRDKILDESIYTGEWFSDHAPLIIDYDIAL